MNEPNGTALQVIDAQALPAVQPTLVRPIASATDVVEAFKTFQDLKRDLLLDDDYQEVQGKKRVKKSGWRKIATAFGISTEMLRMERIPNEDGKSFHCRCEVRAIAPNGRYADGLGIFDSTERRMAHLEHDVATTAYTRACNRAISDLVGGGEVSADELGHPDSSALDAANKTIEQLRAPVPLEKAVKLAADFLVGCHEAGILTELSDAGDGAAMITALIMHRGNPKAALERLKAGQQTQEQPE